VVLLAAYSAHGGFQRKNDQEGGPKTNSISHLTSVLFNPKNNIPRSALALTKKFGADNETVILKYMSTERQVADLLTKSLAKIAFERF